MLGWMGSKNLQLLILLCSHPWAHVMEVCDAYCVCMCGKCSKQRTHWGHHKFSCCVLCRVVVFFSKLSNVLGKPIIWNLESFLCREVHYTMSPSQREVCDVYCVWYVGSV